MPRVPVLDPSVAVNPVQAPEPQVLRPPEDAFGGSVAAARAAQGQQIQRTAQVATNRLIELQQRDDEQTALDQVTKFQNDLQGKLTDPSVDENGVPKGFLSRQLEQARGSTPQFDAVAQQMKQQYLNGVQAPELKVQMAKTLDTHLTAAREEVLHHEASQREASFKNSLDTNVKTNVAAAAVLTEPADVSNAIKLAQAQATGGYMHLGLDPATAEFQNKVLAGEMVKSAVLGSLEQNPAQAKKIFDTLRPQMNADEAASLDKTIEGKMLYDIVEKVSAVAQNMRMADGMIDRSKVDAYVKTLNLSPEQTYQVTSHVDHLAMIDYSETMKKRQDAERSYANDLIQAQSSGVPYDQALKLSTKYGWDQTSIASMQAEATKLYANPQDRFNTWITRQPQPVQSAWAEAEMAVKAKYPASSVGNVGGVNVSLQKSALDELKQDSLGKSADQIRDLVKQKLDKVVVGPYSFLGFTLPINKTDAAWKVDANTRADVSSAFTRLEKDFGTDRVGRVKARLAMNRLPITPANVLRVLNEADKSGDEK